MSEQITYICDWCGVYCDEHDPTVVIRSVSYDICQSCFREVPITLALLVSKAAEDVVER